MEADCRKAAGKTIASRLDAVKGAEVDWLGATFKNIETLGERSAVGLPDNNGALLVQLPSTSLAAKKNLQRGDVTVKIEDHDIHSISDLLQTYQSVKWMGSTQLTISRNQSMQTLNVAFK